VLLPFVLIYVLLLINRKGIMKEWTNSPLYNVVTWASVITIIGLTVAYTAITIRDALPKH
jgi:Mn2+/Fe2+ NRAMP family transporter